MTATSVDAIAATSLYATSAATVVPKQKMDQEMFLKLLVAQLRNQDPTAPMDTTEMMSQSTQLATMEQLTAVADTSKNSYDLQMRVAAGSLVGQEVGFVQDGVDRTGVVSAVSFKEAVPTVTVGEWTVPLSSISTVRSASSSSSSTDSAGSAGSAA